MNLLFKDILKIYHSSHKVMEIQNGSKRVFNNNNRLDIDMPSSSSVKRSNQVCFHWRAGRCNRNPCQYLHSEVVVPLPPQSISSSTIGGTMRSRQSSNEVLPQYSRQLPPRAPNKWTRQGQVGVVSGGQKRQDKVCTYWMNGKCSYGDGCKYLHQWFIGDSFTFLSQLVGHGEDVISGIALPLGSDKLFSAGSKDKSVRVWDCHTGQCASVIPMEEGEIGCMISEGPWIFVGLPNVVKAWNTQTNSTDQITTLSCGSSSGQVLSLAVANEMLFAGTQDGSILAWRFSAATNSFEPAASLKGHKSAVVSLVVGANSRLYSGSMDHMIRVWDLATLQCIQTLTEHTSVVMSVLCWDEYLISCSLDQTIKVWAATESGNLEVTYTHKVEHGVLTLCGMHDEQAKPVLLCGCNDNTVRLYDLPSFNERGKIFAKEEIREIQLGSGGIFFTGNANGELKVWKWRSDQSTPAS